MKATPRSLALLLAVALSTAAYSTQAAAGQSFAGGISPAGMEGDPSLGNAPDSGPYADGTRAINESRWSDAVAIFSRIVGEKGPHADGALYWKAYAENRQGKADHALLTCAELRRSFPSSSWMDECGALEIEVKARTGKPVLPRAVENDDLKLLALNLLMQQDEKRAMEQIQEILDGASSEKLKEGALLLLGEHHTDQVNPQIVRVSYVEGDVRIERGEKNEKETGTAWEKAVADLPLETGFTLATGKGRAEIEFENASPLYLGENSVLTFNDLHTTGGVPYTEVALLTGTVSMHIRPFVPGEMFVLKTPTDTLTTRYPGVENLRVDSYLDGIAITALENGVLAVPATGQVPLSKSQSVYYHNGHTMELADAKAPETFAAFDQWVSDRFAQRSTAVAELLKDSGLSAPIPGLAEMKGKGTFSECAPYGTCWEPSEPDSSEQGETFTGERADRDSSEEASHGFAGAVPMSAQDGLPMSGQGASARANAARAGVAGRPEVVDEYSSFPCSPFGTHYRMVRDPNTGKEQIDYGIGGGAPWNWAVCHSGSWIQRNHRYVWVVGHRRHHHPPVHWVRVGRSVAFVPIHPRDVKGQLPVNRLSKIFELGDKKGTTVRPITYDPTRPLEVLKAPPKEFREEHLTPLAKVEAPHLEAHMMKDLHAGKEVAVKTAGIPLSFDHKSQSFMMPKQVTQGNRSVTVFAPVTNRGGDLQARGGSYAGGSGGRGSSGIGGGGSRSGGGGSSSSGGGGGSRGGGGSSISVSSGSSSTSSSSASSSSASSSASSGSSGGGHH
jgi:hypothetical protein